MPAEKVTVDRFIELSGQYPVLDVRSPGEFKHARIPGAYSFPLFTDEERKVVGTAYKQQGRETAIKIGLDYFGGKMRRMVEEAEGLTGENSKTVLVHCWRGGMRSAGVAWLLDLYGFKVFTLVGGYKSFRNWVLASFERPYNLRILGGYTGSGKTPLLHELVAKEHRPVDLEDLAKHKGSAFGSFPETPQPSQEMFENLLAFDLRKKEDSPFIWLEDESQRIGLINLPMAFWNQMRSAPVYFLNIPFETRLEYIVKEYGKMKKDQVAAGIIRIQKRLGGLETKTAMNFLMEGNTKDCFAILLKYYDRFYIKGLNKRDHLETLLRDIPSDTVDPSLNAKRLLSIPELRLKAV